VLTRAFFLGTGVYVALFGATLFLVDRITLVAHSASTSSAFLTWLTTNASGEGRVLNPPDWAPYTLVAVGTVTVLYAIALPKAAWKKE
jgi:hypothetical protein